MLLGTQKQLWTVFKRCNEIKYVDKKKINIHCCFLFLRKLSLLWAKVSTVLYQVAVHSVCQLVPHTWITVDELVLLSLASDRWTVTELNNKRSSKILASPERRCWEMNRGSETENVAQEVKVEGGCEATVSSMKWWPSFADFQLNKWSDRNVKEIKKIPQN